MSSLEMLELYKADAMVQLADNERYIATLHERIAKLEYHLGRCRDSAFQVFSATAGVLPMEFAPDIKTKTKSEKKVKK